MVLALPLVLLGGDFIPLLFPYTLSVSVGADGTVLAFLVAVGLVAGVVFGLAPSWAVSRRNAVEALREGASSSGRSRTRLRDLLVVVQLGLSLALVTGAGLLGRSVLNAASAQPGFRPDGLTAAFINLSPTGRYEDEESGRELWRRVMGAARDIPGVRAVTLANQVPVTGGHSRATVRPLDRPETDFEAERVVVGPDYFQVTGTPILQGRPLRGLEDEPERVVVVNEALARMFWPGENAVGKELTGDPGWRVVGVAGDVQMRSLRRPGNPGVYYPLSQVYDDSMVLHLLAEPGQRVSGTAIREAVASVDPELPVSSVVDLKAALTASMGETRTVGFLVGAFAVLALALAVVGLYGLVAYSASQRVREMGIRTALGAEPRALVRLVLARGLVVSVLGILLGLGTSLALGQALRGLLFGVAPTDLPVLGCAAALLLFTAGVAAWMPARRASRVDASVSLREE
jgi:predicted permease